ncbi:unnamed protein product [Cunninghamella blakesleeana]
MSMSTFSNDSYFMYGGWNSGNDIDQFIDHPFVSYNTVSNTWSSIPLPQANNYNSEIQVINLPNNHTFWIWGGSLNSSGNQAPNILRQYNYQTNQWLPDTLIQGSLARSDHTATLASNGIIYIIGGGIIPQSDKADFGYVPLKTILTYNTQNSQWQTLNATGDTPSSRIYHTTNLIPDTTKMIILGGVFFDHSSSPVGPCLDSCFIYDYVANNYQRCNLPSNSNISSTRFGHSATIYKSNYLIVNFGFVAQDKGANSIDVLNITNTLNPTWVISSSNNSNGDLNNGNNSYSSGHGSLSTGALIAIIVVIVVLVIALVIALVFFIRHRRKQRREMFILEQDDPRHRDSTDLNHDDFIIEKSHNHTQPSTTIYNNNSSEYSSSSRALQIISTDGDGDKIYIKPSEAPEIIKPSETVDLIKPSI